MSSTLVILPWEEGKKIEEKMNSWFPEGAEASPGLPLKKELNVIKKNLHCPLSVFKVLNITFSKLTLERRGDI